ncbi:Fip1 motif-domain-containing protein, partial [Schizophyllum fasciatum]
QPSLTTEYQPIQRGVPTPSTQAPAPQPLPQSSTPAPSATTAPTPQLQPKPETEDDGVDPNTLPPATRAESQPEIDPGAPGVFEGRSIIDVDLAALADKPWRRPGADISDWFNYGFDEISWEAYCYRRRDLGELADVLKANVLNFSGMPEDQLTQLPPEVRQMVMTGTNALMNNAAAAGGMMPNAGMMMDMGGMMDMGMGGMGGGGMGGMGGMPMDHQQQQGGTPKPDFEGMEGGMGYGMGMGMGEYGMQEQQQMQQQMGGQMNPQMAGQMNPQMQQQMGGQMGFQGMEGPSQSPPVPAAGRGAPPPFRGRGSLRGRGGFQGRGRGHGACTHTAVPTPPVRSTSPLPPNVPTGPRNQNKYKDRDNNAQSVDGLDYGGGASARTHSREPD